MPDAAPDHRIYVKNVSWDIPANGICCIVPDQPYTVSPHQPNTARNYINYGKRFLEVRVPTLEDEHRQDLDMVLVSPNGIQTGEFGFGVCLTNGPAMMYSDLVGETEDDTVTEEQYQGIPLGISAGSFYLHRGGACFRLKDWAFTQEDEEIAFCEVTAYDGGMWFKTEEELFSENPQASEGVLHSALVDLYYMGKDDSTNQSTLVASEGLRENEPIQVRAYHMGGSIPAGSYGQLSRVGGKWCVSAVYC